MTMAARYRARVRSLIGEDRDADEVRTLMPQLLVEACLSVVPVDGAGLSSGVRLRIPIAASSPQAREIEALQTTLGEGPCLSAALDFTPSVADLDMIAERWPVYHHELLAQSVFRSTCSLPLGLPWPQRVVLDLYSRDPKAAPFADVEHLQEQIGRAVTELVAESLELEAEAIAVPDWGSGHPARERMEVWSAIGILMTDRRIAVDAALSLLRGHAFEIGITLNELAARLATGEIPEADLDR